MKIRKVLAGLLAAVMVVPMAACGPAKEEAGKVNITIGNWPADTDPSGQERMAKLKDEFMAQNPDINIITDTTYYDTKNLNLKGSAKQLATLYACPVTEVSTAYNAGYAKPITKYMDKYGFTEAMNPEVLSVIKGGDGEIYAIPLSAYKQGFYINKKIFKEAGLVNEDGSIKYPKTWEEVAEYAKTVTEKTGKAGFAFPTINNVGGWLLLNIARGYGADFVKQNNDGKYEAIFNTPEFVEALKYVQDLKWKYDTLHSDTNMDQIGMYKYFATDQAAMMIATPPCNWLYSDYSMDFDNAYVVPMPAGPKGAYAQIGADINMISSEATDEQVEACFKWLMFMGNSPQLSDEQVEKIKSEYEQSAQKGNPILDRDGFPIFSKGDAFEIRKAARADYVNVDMSNYEKYFDTGVDVTIFPEPPVCAQQMYAVLDGVIQELITNKDADPAALAATACEDFQVNHLDKLD